MNIDVEGDWIRARHYSVWYLKDYWDTILQLLDGMDFPIVHQYREGNLATNILARCGKEGITRRFEVFDLLPNFLSGMMRVDRLGLPNLC